MLCFSTVSLFAIERVRVMRFLEFVRRPWVQFAGVGLAAAAVGVSVQTWATTPTQSVAQAIKARLPKTQITSVNCDGFGGLCEVVAGPSLFYVDPEARFLIVGRLYNMETRQDVTASCAADRHRRNWTGRVARLAPKRRRNRLGCSVRTNGDGV